MKSAANGLCIVDIYTGKSMLFKEAVHHKSKMHIFLLTFLVQLIRLDCRVLEISSWTYGAIWHSAWGASSTKKTKPNSSVSFRNHDQVTENNPQTLF